MEYKIKDICNALNLGVYKFYRLKDILDNSVPEQNRIEYYYNIGRNFFITDKGFEWFKSNINNNFRQNNLKVNTYQNQIIEMYKKENEYLRQENNRLLSIIEFKEKSELAQSVKILNSSEDNKNNNIFSKFFNILKNKN